MHIVVLLILIKTNDIADISYDNRRNGSNVFLCTLTKHRGIIRIVQLLNCKNIVCFRDSSELQWISAKLVFDLQAIHKLSSDAIITGTHHLA